MFLERTYCEFLWTKALAKWMQCDVTATKLRNSYYCIDQCRIHLLKREDSIVATAEQVICPVSLWSAPMSLLFLWSFPLSLGLLLHLPSLWTWFHLSGCLSLSIPAFLTNCFLSSHHCLFHFPPPPALIASISVMQMVRLLVVIRLFKVASSCWQRLLSKREKTTLIQHSWNQSCNANLQNNNT